MILNDSLLAFPGLLLALFIMAISGASREALILALSVAYMPAVVRVARASVLSVREREYIEASRVMGNSELVTMVRHVLPNCMAPITVLATTMFGWVILSESALSFLGLGVPPPAPSWGNMLASGRPVHHAGAVFAHFAGPVHLADAARHQHAGRRAARLARPEDAGLMR